MKPIEIDLTGLAAQFGLSAAQIDTLTETCVREVEIGVYNNWEALAKTSLYSTLPEYLTHLLRVDKGRFAKQIVLTGTLPNMIEQGASPFDIKEGFKKSPRVRYTIPRYSPSGKMIRRGGDWYLTIPFRIGVPGTLGQAGFTGQMPTAVYQALLKQGNSPLRRRDIPSPWDVPKSRAAIVAESGATLYAAYRHKNSIYEGLTRRTAQYAKTAQNTYGTFRRAGAASDPLSWIHRGFTPLLLSEKAVERTDVETMVENEVTEYLENVL